MNEHTCKVCGLQIKVMIRKGSGICSENCEKFVKASIVKFDAEIEKGQEQGEGRNQKSQVSSTTRNRRTSTANKARTPRGGNKKS